MITRKQGRAVWVALGAAMAIYAALELWLTRGTTMFIDEVAIFQQNRGLHPSALLAPFNEHLELARRLFYGMSLGLFGTGTSFLLVKLVEIAGVILLVGLCFAFLRRRVGPVVALAPALLLLFFGSAWELNFAISGIGNVYALVAGVGALLVLERRGRKADVAACALLVVSVVSFTTGLAFAVGALCLLLLERDSRRRIWVALVPLGVYVAWLLWVRLVYVPDHGEVQHISLYNILLIPNMIAQQASSTAGALTGLNYNFEPSSAFSVFSTSSDYGGLLAALAAVALIWRVRRGAPPLLWALIATLIAYWVELTIGSGVGRTPTTVRYVYAAGAIAILIAAEAVRARPLRSRTTLLIVYGLTAVALIGNLARLREGMHLYRSFATAMRAQLAALELARPVVDPGFVTHLGAPNFVPVTAGPYLAAVRRYGSPAYSPTQLGRQPVALRESADAVLVAALRIAVAPRPPNERLTRCLRSTGTSVVSFTIRPPGIGLSAASPGNVLLGRFASRPGVPVGALKPGQAVDLRIPRDRSTRPWRLTINPPPAGLKVCALPGG